jgi:hypothetical protein
MFRTVRFCVQPYVRRERRLVPAEALQFYSEGEARSRARLMRRRVAGVAVYQVSGWPVQDLWAEPKLIAKAGEVPVPD